MFESQFHGLSDFSLEGSIWSLNWSMYENHCLLKYMLELHFSNFIRFYFIDKFHIRRVTTPMDQISAKLIELNYLLYLSLQDFFVLTCLRMAFVQTETGSTHLKVTVWIQINLSCVQLNECGLCSNKQWDGFHEDWYMQDFSHKWKAHISLIFRVHI